MKKIYYTTTEYLETWETVSEKIHRGDLHVFDSLENAFADVKWLQKNYPESAAKYDGPKIVQITLEVLE